jgi:hypothetical protein
MLDNNNLPKEKFKMITVRLAQARRLYNSDLATREVNRTNQLKWARSIRILGDKWLYARTLDCKSLAQSKAN